MDTLHRHFVKLFYISVQTYLISSSWMLELIHLKLMCLKSIYMCINCVYLSFQILCLVFYIVLLLSMQFVIIIIWLNLFSNFSFTQIGLIRRGRGRNKLLRFYSFLIQYFGSRGRRWPQHYVLTLIFSYSLAIGLSEMEDLQKILRFMLWATVMLMNSIVRIWIIYIFWEV